MKESTTQLKVIGYRAAELQVKVLSARGKLQSYGERSFASVKATKGCGY